MSAGPDCDVLVLGAGVAGMTAALEAARTRRVVLATKTALGDGSTRAAQGGIAVATGAGDVGAHVADTLAAGAGLADPAAARAFCADGPVAVRLLAERGVAFDRDGEGRWAQGLEAAHSRPRVLHAGGDRTGAAVSAALAAAVRRSEVTVLEEAFLLDLLVEEGPAGRTVVGADLLLADTGAPGGERRLALRAGAVVLATGGAGQLFSRTTNPAVATGDGVAAAWRAGAAVADLEMVQFHPTVAAPAHGPAFLVSEAVRGEGALLLDAAGRRFMPDLDPRAELAPRDVVARGVAAAVAAHGGRPALLDATGVAARLGVPFAQRFPGIDRLCREAGIDPEREPVPVTPAAHYWMGGVRTDVDGRTSLAGLWAAGEVACTGLHGANRLASNSLLEALVAGGRVAADTARGGGPARSADDELVELPGPSAPVASHVPRREVQAVMTEHAGLVRDGAGLEVAAKLLTPGEDPLQLDPRPAPGVPRATREDANVLLAARLLVAAATAREDSLGAHFRCDHPHPPASARRRAFRRTP
ncbi:L-aspartate oxidase [Kineococcus sp. SYSU DK006]|uniref:L-aspartate oxidase n=1 Tax=Kineococcus sp. SYSU DK006 TaxID=3383127 RepID=UPI003D7D3B3F